MNAPVEAFTIAILGEGPEAWLAALAMARTVPVARRPVTVLTDPDAPVSSPAVALHPSVTDWHNALRLDDATLVNRAAGAFSFGAALTGWTGPEQTWFNPFSGFGAPIGPVPFYPIALKLRAAGVPMRLSNFSLAALAAQTNRFQVPDRAPGSVLSTCRHGLHADAHGLAKLLRESALAAGVVEEQGTIRDIEWAPDGAVTALRLDGDRRLEAGLWLDASGPAARLASRLQANRRDDWSGLLPCDRRLQARVRTVGTPPPYRHLETMAQGVIEHLPLHGSTALSAWFDASEIDDESVHLKVRDAAGAERLEGLTIEPFRPGRAVEPWVANCVALGEAAMQLEPLGPGAFHFARTALQRLLELMPGEGGSEAVRTEFNRRAAEEQDHARDFVLAHYRLNARQGEPFWDAARQGAVTPGLAHRREVFEARGIVPLEDEEPLEADAWLNLFDEHGLVPRHAGPLVAGLDLDTLAGHAEKVRTFMLGALRTMPSHEDTLLSLRVAKGQLESTIESVSLAPPGRGEDRTTRK